MLQFIGRSNSLALFSSNNVGVVLDTELNLIVDSGDLKMLSAKNTWTPTSEEFSENTLELVSGASTTLDITVITASGRMYTIPDGVKSEAKKALEWRKEEKRGGTPVGLNTARTLAKGGQIGIEKVRHIAKYFPRHEVDKKGKGWAPGEDNFPSNGRIAWALWGGDAAWRWSSAIVERENKKAVTADGYMLPGYEDHLDTYMAEDTYEADVNAFKIAHELDMNAGPEFMARIRLDGSGIDRLYKIDIDGTVCVWDEMGWDTLGHVDGDVYTYDKALDDPYDKCEKTHVLIDPSSAVVISAMLQESPFMSISIEDIDTQEAYLVADAMEEEDWTLVDYAMTAAGEGDGIYTSEERSENVKEQPRDAAGLFVQIGGRVVVGGDKERGSGQVLGADKNTGKVTVKLDNGNTINVDSKFTQNAERFSEQKGPQMAPEPVGRIDTSGILGEPRTPSNMPKAHLPGTLKPLTREGLNLMLQNWPKYVNDLRKSYKPLDAADKKRVDTNYKNQTKPAGDAKPLTSAAAEKTLTPETSDVTPKYFAIVSPDDPSAVMDMVALVPKTETQTEPISYKRVEGEWVEDPQIVRDLTSPTPPPVVLLEKKEHVNDVLKQVDGLVNVTASALPVFDIDHVLTVLHGPRGFVAAGGADRNRGGAARLRRYWTRGPGALKIRWGTPGDWTRCVRYLSKYMGPRAKGYCQLRHKEVTGVYTGSKRNVGKNNSIMEFTNAVIEQAVLNARANEARAKFSLSAGATSADFGASFRIPLVIPEEIESGDGRKFKKNSLEIRELPLPLLWQIKTGDGHAGSVVVGRIDYMERIENGIGNAYGVFDKGEYGREAERLVKSGFIRGVSADLDQFEAKEDKKEAAEDEELGGNKLTINHARVMAVTIVPKPAFQECSIDLVADDYASEEEEMIPEDGIYEEAVEAEFPGIITASGFLSQTVPVTPPREWFDDPKLSGPTPITVDDTGRIYGHIAAWHVNHIGMPRSTRPPRSRSKYSYFHTGVVRCDNGKDVPVGQLTLAGGHASLNANAAQAAKHYDDTASAIADVHAGEDQYGIWVSGSIRPDATEMQIRALRASAPSGDWRPIDGSLELVAVCQVNVPGFPIARAMVASGKVLALVAAGAQEMAILKSNTFNHFVQKAYTLGELAATAPNLKARIASAKKAVRQGALTAAAAQAEDLRQRALTAAAVAELAKFSEKDRKELARKGHALPDGSYPIRNVSDLKNAIQAYGRAKDKKEAKKHIIKRAKDLHRYYDLIPEEWRTKRNRAFSIQEMRDRIEEFSTLVAAIPIPEEATKEEIQKLKSAKKEADAEAKLEKDSIKESKTAPKEYDEDGRIKYIPGKTQPRDARGKFRKVLARLKEDLGVAGLQKALERVEEAENLEFAGDYAGSAKAAEDLINTIDRLDSGALDATKIESVRDTAADLGRVISNLPLPFTNQNEKLRFSDLPPVMRTLVEDMITRVEAKIGKEDADVATQKLRSYMSGGDVLSQSEISSEMSTLLRLLT